MFLTLVHVHIPHWLFFVIIISAFVATFINHFNTKNSVDSVD